MKDEPNVTEDLTLVPISVYNKTKMVAERVFLSYADQMQVHLYKTSNRMRVITTYALGCKRKHVDIPRTKEWKITVFGGEQTRPNIHIQDLANVYRHF